MRILSTGDLHIERGDRFADQLDVLEGIVETAREHNVDLVILTGDYFGRVVPYHTRPVERAALADFVARLAGQCSVVMLYGNHDAPGELDPLGHIEDVVIADCQCTIIVDNVAVYCIPFPTVASMGGENAPRRPEERAGWLREQVAARLDLCRASTAQARTSGDSVILAGHFTVHGSEVSGGEVLHGSEVVIGVDALEGVADAVMLGHIHARQEFGDGSIWYNGSPLRVSFSDTGPKSVTIYDTDTRERVFVSTRARPFVTRRIRVDEHGARDVGIVGDVDGAEVRIIVEAPETHRVAAIHAADACADGLDVAGAHRTHIEIRIDPVERVRSPAIAAAVTYEDRLRAVWSTMDEPPDEQAQSDAIALLHEIAEGI